MVHKPTVPRPRLEVHAHAACQLSPVDTTHKCASLTTFMILAMNASMWKIFFDPWRMRSSWRQLAQMRTAYVVRGPVHDDGLERVIDARDEAVGDRLRSAHILTHTAGL